MGREYGLNIAWVDPVIASALTPRDALSLRSSVPMLEGLLTPLLLSHSARPEKGIALRLTGTLEHPILVSA